MKKILFPLLIMGQLNFAQCLATKDSSKIEVLDNVFITANRSATLRKETPTAVSKLNSQTINETKAVMAFELINKTPGVLMPNLGNEQHMMAIRQPMSTNAYYLYLEDGLAIRPMGIFNHNALLEINQFNLQSIEVVKGPVSSLYGSEAVGGTINLISIAPPTAPDFKLGIQGDQWGYKRLQAAGGATIGTFGFYVSGISSIQENGWMSYSDYKKDNINLRLDYKISSKTKLIITSIWAKYYSDMSTAVNEEAFYNRSYKSTTDFTYRKSVALRSKISLEQSWNSQASSFITAYFRDNKLGQNPAYSIKWSPTQTPGKASGEVNSNNYKSYGLIGQHSQKFAFWKSKIVGGALYDYSPVNYWAYLLELKTNLNPGPAGKQTVSSYEIAAERPDIRLADYTAEIYNSAAYAQLSFNPIHNLIVSSGLRYDHLKVNYDNALDHSTGTKMYGRPTFKVGINFNPLTDSGFYANYAQGFSPPGISSVFRTKTGTGGSSGKAAEFYYDLEPATFDNYEIGGYSSMPQGNLSIDYALYYMVGKNELLAVRLPDNSTDYRSVGETLHKGLEFGANYKLLNKQLSIRLGGTFAKHSYIDFKVSDNPKDALHDLNGKEMPQAPKWSGNSEISYYPKWLPCFRTSVEWQTVGDYYQDQINSLKYAGYDLFNLRAAYQWKALEIYGNILNLTDKRYAYNVSRANTAGSQSSYTAAAPRSFLIGIQYNFSLIK